MRLATTLIIGFTAGAAGGLGTGTAWAGAALDDDKKATPTRTTDPAAAPDSLATTEDKVDYGVDIRLRSVHVPKALLELFVDRAADGASNTGIGVDFVRRRGNL